MTDIDNNKLSELVIKLQNGDGKAFEEIYNMTYRTARFTALKILNGNEDDADDVMQDAYMKVLEKIKTIDKPESFMSWFNMIIANRARDVIKKNNPGAFRDNGNRYEDTESDDEDYGDEEDRIPDNMKAVGEENEDYIPGESKKIALIDNMVSDSSAAPGAGVEREAVREAVMGMIDSLSDEKKTAVILYYYNEMTTKQIAESMGVSENTIKSRLVQAKKDLAKSVSAYEKKNGKLLGVAPIPLVVWALKASAASVAVAPYAASGIAAAAAGTATAAAVGSTAAKAAGAGIAAKIAAGLVVAGLVVGGTVAGTKAVKDRKAEKETTTVSETVSETVTAENPEEETAGDFDVTYNAEDMADDKMVDTVFEFGDAKYGVSYASQGFAVRSEDGVDVDQARPVLDRKNYSATYDDLLPAAKENQTTYAENINNTISDINSERTAEGLSKVTVDPVLSEQAAVRAEEIAWSGRDSGTRPDGSSYTTLFDRNGYTDGSRGEIRVFNSTSYDKAIKTILSDSAVKNPDIEKIGVGVAENPENEKLVYVVHLYSSEEDAVNEESDISDAVSDAKNDAIDNAVSQNLETVQELRDFEERVADIPVIGDILTYDFHNDWLMKGFSDFTDELADLIERTGE